MPPLAVIMELKELIAVIVEGLLAGLLVVMMEQEEVIMAMVELEVRQVVMKKLLLVRELVVKESATVV